MKKTGNKLYLYIGLSLLVIAFAVRWLHVLPAYWFWILLGVAISFKTYFLILTFRNKSVKVGWWLYLILAGVVMIFASLLFKNIFPYPVIRNILFFGAILLKIIGLILLLTGKKKRES
ncbi:MAG: hypothetical protein LBE91_14090 [Tannerella sp.]|jgi:hypothetical protein|nr:hypothetical protein [Tannerella sp.]